MSAHLQTQLQSRTIKLLLALALAWSVLQIALITAIHWFHPSCGVAFLLTAVPALPLCLMIAIVARQPNQSRLYIYGITLFAASFLIISNLSVWLEVAFFADKPIAIWGLAIWPLFFSVIFAFALFLPWHKIDADTMLSLRMKLAIPVLRRIFRMTALYIVYISCQFASAMLFDSYALTGILAFAVALLPVLPVFGLIWVYNRYMQEEQDEFQRHLFHQSILWALMGTFIIASALGRLEDYSLIFHRHPGYFHISSIFPLFWWLQLEASLLVNAIQAARISAQEKQNQ